MNPDVASAADLSHPLARLEAELGLTPAARARLRVNGPTPVADDPNAAFLRPMQAFVP